jgi:hypothetical protein
MLKETAMPDDTATCNCDTCASAALEGADYCAFHQELVQALDADDRVSCAEAARIMKAPKHDQASALAHFLDRVLA